MSVWAYTENAPEWAAPLVECWSWGLNCTPGGNPWLALLDLSGWSADEIGESIFPWESRGWSLGWLELGYLAAALECWTDRPSECAAWVNGLHDADREDD